MNVQRAGETPDGQKAWLERLLQIDRRLLIAVALPAAFGVGVLDWLTGPQVALGAAYLFPVVLLSLVATRSQILLLSVACALSRGTFSVHYSLLDFLLRFLLAFAAFAATGLLISEILRHYAQTKGHLRELKEQQLLSQELETHLRELADSSPAAIFTADEAGRILTANRETRHLFGLGDGDEIRGQSAARHLPVLAGALRLAPREEAFRTSTQCQGVRLDGEHFFAQVWFSLYQTAAGRRLAAIAVDISDEMRDREDQNFRMMADQNRIIAGAVSHELKNICGAISMAVANLRDGARGAGPEDFGVLSGLVDALMGIASADLAGRSRSAVAPVSLTSVLGQLRVLIEPGWKECGGSVEIEVEPGTDRVLVDPAGLTQVFLNLANNSLRAVQECNQRRLRFRASRRGPEVHIVVEDTGTGIPPGALLFEPFQRTALGSGLGLYVSRAVLRHYGGDLKYEETSPGCAFRVKLLAAD